jgi:hypothetical protein
MRAVVRSFMKHARYIALTIIFVTSTAVSPVSATPSNTCEELITACFVSAPDERDGCIQSAAAARACHSSELHDLVEKRAQLSLMDQGPAFLGPQMVDRRCLARFDTAWSAALVNGALTIASAASLSAALEDCAKAESPALPHL